VFKIEYFTYNKKRKNPYKISGKIHPRYKNKLKKWLIKNCGNYNDKWIWWATFTGYCEIFFKDKDNVLLFKNTFIVKNDFIYYKFDEEYPYFFALYETNKVISNKIKNDISNNIINEWCSDNCVDWLFRYDEKYNCRWYTYIFKEENDAIAFKMRWV